MNGGEWAYTNSSNILIALSIYYNKKVKQFLVDGCNIKTKSWALTTCIHLCGTNSTSTLKSQWHFEGVQNELKSWYLFGRLYYGSALNGISTIYVAKQKHTQYWANRIIVGSRKKSKLAIFSTHTTKMGCQKIACYASKSLENICRVPHPKQW